MYNHAPNLLKILVRITIIEMKKKSIQGHLNLDDAVLVKLSKVNSLKRKIR